MVNIRFLAAAFLLLSVLHVGSTLQCFECIEEKGGDGVCRDQNGAKHASAFCGQSCIKHTMGPVSVGGIESNELVVRLCIDPSYCQLNTVFMEDKMGLRTRSCTSCKTDYCNSASTAIPSFILVAILAIKYLFYISRCCQSFSF